MVRILVFVDQEIPPAFLVEGKEIGMSLEQLDRQEKKVIEVDCLRALQELAIAFVDPRHDLVPVALGTLSQLRW
ncbi:hypothetical protein HRbin27_01049 [bacterium HR27]|nr:hypothetical protein HRbin27_01049 [bacterium HR27]